MGCGPGLCTGDALARSVLILPGRRSFLPRPMPCHHPILLPIALQWSERAKRVWIRQKTKQNKSLHLPYSNYSAPVLPLTSLCFSLLGSVSTPSRQIPPGSEYQLLQDINHSVVGYNSPVRADNYPGGRQPQPDAGSRAPKRYLERHNDRHLHLTRCASRRRVVTEAVIVICTS